jgi:hypothetical protein
VSFGGAVAGQDFVAATGTLVFPDGVAAAAFSVPIIDDATASLYIGTFRVILANPTGGTSIDSTGSSMTVELQDNETLTVCDDDTNNCLEGLGGGAVVCFIATAAYGSNLDPHVVALREFRDRYLQTNAPGRAFVRWYYATSPSFAAWIAQHGLAGALTRLALTPLVYAVAKPY